MLNAQLTVARSELILGGQKSGKSRRAEALGAAWLAQAPSHRAVLIATAQPWDEEMRVRIARHQADRLVRVPRMATVEEPLALADAIHQHSRTDTLVVVDCLTLWLTNLLMPAVAPPGEIIDKSVGIPSIIRGLLDTFLIAVQKTPVPLILVGNEIGLGVVPLGREVRAFVDTLGRLNQDVAAGCQRVTLMAAGLPLTLKDAK